jgi:hypothetical protein
MPKNMANILYKPPLRITIKNAGNRHARRKRPVKPFAHHPVCLQTA